MLAPDFFEPLPDRAALPRELDRSCPTRATAGRAGHRAALGPRAQFQAGIQILLSISDGDAAGRS